MTANNNEQETQSSSTSGGRGRDRAGDPKTSSKLERCSGHGSLAEDSVQERDSGRYFVSIKSYRQRLLDKDNLCPKYHLDSLRYSGLIPEDNPNVIDFEVSQTKVSKKSDEKIRVILKRIE